MEWATKSNKDITRIGAALGAAYILEGSVRREADRLRITARLIQVGDQTHLWTGDYDRRIHDALTIQSEVAERVAQSLAVKLLPSLPPALAQTYIPSPDSYDAYLRGCYLRNKWTREDLEKGLGYFEQAVEYDEAIAQSRRTMELEPNFAETWGCLMRAYQYKGMLAEAIAEAQRIMTRSGASREELVAIHQGDAASRMRRVEQWMLNRAKKAAARGYVSDYQLATRYAALGEKEQAFEWLEKAYTDRDPMMALLNTDPVYDRLRSEPRFGDLLRRIRVAAQAVHPQ